MILSMEAFEVIARPTVVLAVAALAALLLRGFAPNVRHSVWLVGLVASVGTMVLPLAGMTIWNIPWGTVEPVRQIVSEAAINATPSVPWLALVWIGGTVFSLMWVVAGIMSAQRFAERTDEITQRLEPLVARAATLVGCRRRIAVAESSGTSVPLVWGLNRPVVILPLDWTDWPDEMLEAVLVHEISHVVRGDLFTRTLARVARSVLWFHPLSWLAESRVVLEAENACDQMSTEVHSDRVRYAEFLVHLARKSRETRGREPLLAMARKSGLESRLRALAVPGSGRQASAAWVIAAGVVVAACTSVTSVEQELSVSEQSGGVIRRMSDSEAAEARGRYRVSPAETSMVFVEQRGGSVIRAAPADTTMVYMAEQIPDQAATATISERPGAVATYTDEQP